MSQERRCYQQQQHQAIGNIGEQIVCLVVYQQQRTSQYQRAQYPDKLFTGAVGEIEDTGLIEVIAGSVYIEPTEQHQPDEHAYRRPVHVLQYATIS